MTQTLPDDAPDARLLKRCPCFADAERRARTRIPRFLEGYLSGACDGEEGLERNRRAFESVELTPRYGVDVGACDPATALFGKTCSAPVGVGPVGFAGGFWPGIERAMAAAAARHRLPFIASTVAVLTLEELAAAGDGNVWFQLYMVDDEAINRDLLRRAAAAGIDTLVITLDVPVYSKRNRDKRSGLDFPYRLAPRHLWDMACRPAWTAATLASPRPSCGNLLPYAPEGRERDAGLHRILRMRNAVTWEALAEVRQRWRGRLLAKGILATDDARRALDAGVDGIIVSNHGGRQFDAAPASITMLPSIVEAVGGRAAVILDSGIRSGVDVLRALALGADFCLAGRPFYWTGAAFGAAGADHAMRLFRSEIRLALGQAGLTGTGDRAALRALVGL